MKTTEILQKGKTRVLKTLLLVDKKFLLHCIYISLEH